MTFADVRKGEIISGYKCTGHTKCGQWAKFAIDNTQEWTREQRDEWERQKKQKRRAIEQAEAKRREESLSLQERDKQYRELLEILPLSAEDKADLKRRGFSDLEIELCGIKSVESYQQLQKQFSHLLPGVSQNGKTLITNGGYLLPVRNVDGLIVACQVRLRGISTEGRYRWLSSNTKDNPDGQSPHVHGKGFSELPLAVHRPQLKPQGIGLVEGTGTKPFKASLGLNLIVVGASGGQWTSSPNLLQKYLAEISLEIETHKQIKLFPDAGDVQNKAVVERWRKTCNLLTDLGYIPLIGWWGQVGKEDNDIDELENFDGIQYISPKDFFAIAERELYENKRSDRAKIKFTRKADIEVNVGYLPTYSLKDLPPGIIAIKGDWGIGKSFLTASICQEWEGRIIQPAHLNSILYNTAPKYGLMHHHEAKKLDLSLTSVPRIAITDVTLAVNFKPESWAKGERFILVWDEICQGLKSLHTNPNLKGKLRVNARTRVEWLIQNATYILAADRDLDDETLEYIERVRGDGRKAFVIHHTGKKGKNHKPITINKNKNKDEVLTRLINDAKAGRKLAIACENKSDLLAIESLLKDAGVPEELVFLAHGDNSNEPHIKPVIEAIDSQYTEYSILGYTMTMGTAVSLERPHFDKVYAFFSGDVLTASDQSQMLFRYRPDCEKTIWVNPRRRTLEIDPDNLLRNLKIKTDETNKLITSIDEIANLHDEGILPTARGEITADDLPFLQHKLSIISRINASKANPFQSLYDLLIDAGFTINLERTDAEEPVRTNEGEIHKEQKKAIKEESDRSIAEAELMNEVEFQSATINAGSLRKSERDRLAKTKLHRDTGLEITQEIVKLQRTKKLVQGARLLKVLLGDSAAAVAYDLVDRERNPDVGDQSFYSATRRLLCKLGIPEIIEKLRQGWGYTNDSPEVVAAANEIREQRKDVKRLLGFTVSLEKNKKGSFKVSNAALLGSILNTCCVERESTKSRKQGNIYKLNTQHWEMLEAIMAHMDTQAHTPTLQGVIDKAKFEASQVVNSQQSTVNSHEETDMSQQSAINSQQFTEADWLKEENLQDLAVLLDYCQNPEMLAELRAIVPYPSALRVASRRLPEQKREVIRQWVQVA
ncbi:hypothetical protein BV378_26515 [Nostoc sp. RF31YmG]|nr:hypothetical protein BV378_26515 [Nostoc sp. RF31YmG]